ncbi:hypothetical protein K488DRAFT_41524 [Vararia minispora EC-137]|uniref:Uncharacterized protein n=1 Tax=Vararia minispora EC-137 TaxID=1314806 RepID=A0ACB8QXK7_9AGAM|nr:hypothetical protein K488DRAFT_41524 [Vararia minispora EC-137]
MSQFKPLVGSVLERKPGLSSTTSSRQPQSTKTGFPVASHRSQSAFARGRDASRTKNTGIVGRPTVPPSVTPLPAPLSDDWRGQVGKENARKVAEMTQEEREREKREIMERFGPNIAEVLKRARIGREREQATSAAAPADTLWTNTQGEPARSRSPVRSILSSPTSRAASPSRLGRKLRFADVTPSDVFVYESQPSSPKRKPLALPPPPTQDNDAVSLGSFKSPLSFSESPSEHARQDPTNPPDAAEPEEGTAEYIRRRFFPDMPANDPNLEWMSSDLPNGRLGSGLRFDFSGKPIPADLSEQLPTYLGLHHHAEGSHAGYTLDDVFLLCRSTVPAQRTTMLGVLARIVHCLARRTPADGLSSLDGKEEEIRTRALAAGAEAMSAKGGVAVLAVDVLWECIVGWEAHLTNIDGVELQPEPEENTKDALTTLQLEFFLAQVADAFGVATLPASSLLQLLEIIRRLAKHTAAIAEAIVKAPLMLPNMMRLFVLTPISPSQDGMPPSPLAVQMLTTLVNASRAAATVLVDPADSLLRYITLLPPSSPLPRQIANAMLAETLTFYASLASYGLYSNIATTAQDLFIRLRAYVLSPDCDSRAVRSSYAILLERWIVCATDPHRTTPEHEILWSQVSGWDWAADLMMLAGTLGEDEREWGVWRAVWDALAAWLEGARVNGVRGGEAERSAVVEREGFKASFESGTPRRIVEAAIVSLQLLVENIGDGQRREDIPHLRAISLTARVLSSAIRLWIACSPPNLLQYSPFYLPLGALDTLTFSIACSPLLSSKYNVSAPPYLHVFCRSLTTLLMQYAKATRRVPETSEERWLGLACGVVVSLMPGDEEAAEDLVSSVLGLIDPKFLVSKGLPAPAVIWERGGMSVIRPFLTFYSLPTGDGESQSPLIGPLVPTPSSIKLATTQTLPPAWAVRRSRPTAGLPYPRDWPFLPLEHLLKSGTSPVWYSLPADWDASETEVVRATLLLAKVVRDVLVINGLGLFAVQRAEVVFGCMRVFMLEHGQVQGAPTEGASGVASMSEVFRDAVITTLLDDILAPYVLQKSPTGLSLLSATPDDADLEATAARYLGTGTPFFQFYTDFVALYDAVSFGHASFGALLLPPLSRAYAADYRRLLLGDMAHVLGSVRTPAGHVPGARIGAFLWPTEDDPQVLGAYVGLLVGRRARGVLGEFVRWLVVHHVAASIWPDLRPGTTEGAEERAHKLLEAIVAQGRIEDVREIAGYAQGVKGNAVLPPNCFEAAEGEVRKKRMEWVRTWADARIIKQLEGLLH